MPAITSNRDEIICALEAQIHSLLDQAGALQRTVALLKHELAQQDASRGSKLHRLAPLVGLSVRELDLAARTKNLLWGGGITTVGALVAKTRAQILGIGTADTNTLAEIETELARRGCSLGMTLVGPGSNGIPAGSPAAFR